MIVAAEMPLADTDVAPLPSAGMRSLCKEALGGEVPPPGSAPSGGSSTTAASKSSEDPNEPSEDNDDEDGAENGEADAASNFGVAEEEVLRLREVLPKHELAAMQALEAELGTADLERIRASLWPGEATDSCLLRWLGCHSNRVHPTAKALRAHLAWREVKRPGELALLVGEEVVGSPREVLSHFFPMWHQGEDRFCRPLTYNHIGRFNFDEMQGAGITPETFLQLQMQGYETMARRCGEQSRKHGRHISESLLILDAEGLDPQVLCRRIAVDWSFQLARMVQDHYPDRMGQVVIINAPAAVHAFWTSVSWLLPKDAKKAVQILGGREQWAPALAELVAERELAADYGGMAPALPGRPARR